MILQCALLKCYTILQNRDSSVNIPLPPDQHHCSDEAKWRIGGHTHTHTQTDTDDRYTPATLVGVSKYL